MDLFVMLFRFGKFVDKPSKLAPFNFKPIGHENKVTIQSDNLIWTDTIYLKDYNVKSLSGLIHTKSRMQSHSGGTETKVKEIVSDIPPHTNQNIGIFQQKNHNIEIILPADSEKTHISVILYYKIDHFCPLKSNFHPFPAI